MNNWETKWRNTYQVWDEHIVLERQVVQVFSNVSLLFLTLDPTLILDWLQPHQPTRSLKPIHRCFDVQGRERGWPQEAKRQHPFRDFYTSHLYVQKLSVFSISRSLNFLHICFLISPTPIFGSLFLWILPGGIDGKKCLPRQETYEMWVQSLGREDPLEKGMTTHSSILAWRIPWTEVPGGLQSIGSQSQTQLKQLSTHITPCNTYSISYSINKFPGQ